MRNQLWQREPRIIVHAQNLNHRIEKSQNLIPSGIDCTQKNGTYSLIGLL